MNECVGVRRLVSEREDQVIGEVREREERLRIAARHWRDYLHYVDTTQARHHSQRFPSLACDQSRRTPYRQVADATVAFETGRGVEDETHGSPRIGRQINRHRHPAAVVRGLMWIDDPCDQFVVPAIERDPDPEQHTVADEGPGFFL